MFNPSSIFKLAISYVKSHLSRMFNQSQKAWSATLTVNASQTLLGGSYQQIMDPYTNITHPEYE